MDKNQLKHIIKEEYHNVKSFMEDKYGFTPELGKVISNPYAKSFVNEVQEPEVISQLRDIVNKKQNKKIKDPKSGKMMRVDMYSASAVIAVYDALRKPNVKVNFASQPLPKMINVAFKVAKVRKENVAKNHDGKAAPYGSGYKKVNEEKVYIDFLNKKKGFKQDRIHFDNYKKAVKWARKNLEKFHPDMIHYESVNEGSMDWEKNFPWANEKELKVISKFINMNKRGIDGVLKMQKKDFRGFMGTVQKMVKLLPLMEIMEGKYNYKDDAMTAYMKGKISAQELDKIAKNDFKSSVATKQELQNFLKAGYMKELMANTYGLKVSDMEKKVKELMKYAS